MNRDKVVLDWVICLRVLMVLSNNVKLIKKLP